MLESCGFLMFTGVQQRKNSFTRESGLLFAVAVCFYAECAPLEYL